MEAIDKISGSFAVNSGASISIPTRIVMVPSNAKHPATLTVRNLDPAAIMYLQWVSGSSGTSALSVNACGIRLEPGVGYTWDALPFGSQLLCLSTVPNALLGVDGSWGLG